MERFLTKEEVYFAKSVCFIPKIPEDARGTYVTTACDEQCFLFNVEITMRPGQNVEGDLKSFLDDKNATTLMKIPALTEFPTGIREAQPVIRVQLLLGDVSKLESFGLFCQNPICTQ